MTWQSVMWLIGLWPGASLCVKPNPLNVDRGEHKVSCVGDCHVACSWGFYGIFLILSLRQLKCMHSTVGVYNNSGPSLTLIFKKANPHPPTPKVFSTHHQETRAVFWAIISHQWCLWAINALSGLTASTMCVNLIMKPSKGNLKGLFLSSFAGLQTNNSLNTIRKKS